MFVISQDSKDVVYDILWADVRVCVVGCVSHTLRPLAEDFELFVAHVM